MMNKGVKNEQSPYKKWTPFG